MSIQIGTLLVCSKNRYVATSSCSTTFRDSGIVRETESTNTALAMKYHSKHGGVASTTARYESGEDGALLSGMRVCVTGSEDMRFC